VPAMLAVDAISKNVGRVRWNHGGFIRSGIAASAIGHLSILTAVLIFTEVHPFGAVTAEPITVDLVSPEEAAKKAEPVPTPRTEPSDSFDLSSKSAPSSSPAPVAAATATPQPQKQAALSSPRVNEPQTQQANVQPPPPSTSPLPGYRPAEPDLSLKYHVLLGLPSDLPPSPEAKSGDFDAPASKTADIASSLIMEFRRHLRTCLETAGLDRAFRQDQGYAAGADDA